MNDGDDDGDGGDYDADVDDDADVEGDDDADDFGTCESTSVAGRLFWQGQARRQRRRSVCFLIISFITSLHCLSFTWLPSRPLLKSTRKLRSLANESFETVLQLSL